LLALVQGVGLKRRDDLRLLGGRQSRGRDDGDLLLLVELLVQLGVLGANLFDVEKTLVLSENGQEMESSLTERSSFSEGLVELIDFFGSDATILGEETEGIAVTVQFMKVLRVFVHSEEGIVLGGSGEQNARVAALNGIFLRGWLVVGSRLDLTDVSKVKRLEQSFGKRIIGFRFGRISLGFRFGCGFGLHSCGFSLHGRALSSGFGSGLTTIPVPLSEETHGGVVERLGLGGLRSGKHTSRLEGLEETGSDHLYNIFLL